MGSQERPLERPAVPSVRIKRMTVAAGRLSCEVEVDPPGACTTPELMERLCSLFPRLPRHACVNDRGPVFGSVMDCTPLPHALEHLVVELQAQAAAKEGGRAPEGGVFVGTTEWSDEARTKAVVRVSFADDFDALRAFKDAAACLDDALRYTAAL